MKAALAGFWICALGVSAYAQGPSGSPAPAIFGEQRPAIEAIVGKVLLLDNDRILEGDVERVGNRYRIRRKMGGELWIPVDRAKRLCRDADDALLFMRSRANLNDPDERLRLARWCQINQLPRHALQEAKIAAEMRPNHVESRQLVDVLERLAASAGAVPPPAPPVAPMPTPAVALKPAVRAGVDVTQESLASFSSKVQPILLNKCFSCHQASKGTAFRLVRPAEGASRAGTQANLQATLDQVQIERIVISPLLLKAALAHGGADQAPLKGRQSPAFQVLQTWVEQTVASNPHLRELRQAESGTSAPVFGATPTARPAPLALPIAPPPAGLSFPTPPVLPAEAITPGVVVSRPAAPKRDPLALPPGIPPAPANVEPTPSRPAPPPAVDPFDPAEFNRRNEKK